MFNSLQNDLSISDLFRGDLQLSSPPTIYFVLQKVIEHPGKSLDDAAFIIEKDAALSLKLLKMKKGKKGGLQYHHKKNECGYILSGKLRIRFDNGKGKLKEKILS